MKAIFRTAVLAVSLGLSAAAVAQTAKAPASNPVGRGDNVFFFSPLEGQARSNPIGNPLANQANIGRPTPRAGQVTPVPEPGEWAMLLAGLALVGFIVRRNSKRS
jgi:hypothetical protein